MTAAGGLFLDPYALSVQDGLAAGAGFSGYQDTKSKARVSPFLVNGQSTAVMLTFGQSKSDNIVQADSYSVVNPSVNHNFNFYDGCCYTSGGGLLGNAIVSTNAQFGQSYMTVLADLIITAGSKARVILVPIAVSGTSITEWDGGTYVKRFGVVARRLADSGLTITHCLWDQGETDAANGMSAGTYTGHVTSMRGLMTAAGITAPLYVAVTSWTGAATNAAIRTGQANSVNGTTILGGPDLDTIGNVNREDTVHFNPTGAGIAASLWKTAIGL